MELEELLKELKDICNKMDEKRLAMPSQKSEERLRLELLSFIVYLNYSSFNNSELNFIEKYLNFTYTDKTLKEPITRLEMVLMLSKTQIKMKNIPQNQIGHLVYTDIDDLTDDERDLLLHAAKYDLLEGMKDGTSKLFEPNKNLTRGEAAAALMRIY